MTDRCRLDEHRHPRGRANVSAVSIAAPEVWLERLIAAEEAALRTGAGRRSFMLMPRGGMDREVDHPGWDPSWATPTEHDIDDLVEEGWVRLDAANYGMTRTFSLTVAGRLRGLRSQRARAGAQRIPVSMEWTVLEPTLDAAILAYEEAGAPEGGVPATKIPLPQGVPPATLSELTRTGLLLEHEASADQVEGPGFVSPSLDAYRLRRNWPADAADAAIERLVAYLLQQADATDDPEEQTRLRRVAAWLGRVGTDIITGVGTSVASGQAGHIF
jgi:hypothetical protein